MRYKVVVTKVEQAERWIRATDEEAAAQKVKEELISPWAYAGRWEIKATEVEVVEAEPELSRIQQESVSASGPMLLKLKDAASELGISYGTLHTLITRGDIEFTRVGSSKYISRASLRAFIEGHTQR